MSVTSFLSPMFWDEIANSNYIRIELYAMNWTLLDIDLTALIGVGAPYSGPVALRLDTSKLVKSSLANKWKDITVFSSSGNLLAKIEKPNKMLTMGWTLEEDLVCVSEDGQVNVFDLEGRPRLFTNKVLSFGSDVRDISIIDALVYNEPKRAHTGVAILTTQFTFYVMPSVEQETYLKYPDVPGLNMPPSCWCVYFPEGSKACILLAKEKFMYTLSPDGTITETLLQTRSPVDTFVACALSRNCNYLALMGNTGVVWLGTANMKTKFAEYDTKQTHVPKEFAWCGTSAVVMYDNRTRNLSLIDLSGQCLRYDVANDVILISEMDALRIFSEENHELMQKVPQSVVSICSMASTTAGANLFAAAKLFSEESAKSYDYLEEYRQDMEVAVDQCILAALECHFPNDQEELLRAASFGKCFTSDPSGAEKFASACRTLRVLNNIRDPQIGVPLTHQQYKALGFTSVVDRMILRNLWPLAVSICEHLQIPEAEGASRVKKHWACWKITQDTLSSRKMADEELAKVIRNKLEKSSGISYADIAKRAIDCQRDELAIQLLNFETRSSHQIHLLIKLNRHSVALDKAIQSGDPFSIYDVIINLQNCMSSLEFQRLITSNKRALSYYMKYLKNSSRDQLLRMYGQNDDYFNQGLCKLDESYHEISNDNKVSVLKEAKADFVSAKAEIVSQLTEDQIRLYKSQQALEDSLRCPKQLFGQSLHTYILNLVKRGRYKEADNVKKDFKMSDKKYWWIKIEGLAAREDFSELDKFSKSKKSPIGYGPFVELCLKYGRRQEADRYLQRIPTEERVMSYIRMGDLEKAAEQAFVNKSVEELNRVADRVTVALSAAASPSASSGTAGSSTSAGTAVGVVSAQNLRALMTRIQVNVEKLNS